MGKFLIIFMLVGLLTLFGCSNIPTGEVVVDTNTGINFLTVQTHNSASDCWMIWGFLL